MGDGFACEGGVEGFANVVGCFVAIGGVGRWDAIDSTRVDNFSFGVDNKYLGGGFGTIFLADISCGIEENGGGRSIHVFAVGFGLGSGAVTLFAWGGGDDGEPDDPFGGVLLLEFLHISA